MTVRVSVPSTLICLRHHCCSLFPFALPFSVSSMCFQISPASPSAGRTSNCREALSTSTFTDASIRRQHLPPLALIYRAPISQLGLGIQTFHRPHSTSKSTSTVSHKSASSHLQLLSSENSTYDPTIHFMRAPPLPFPDRKHICNVGLQPSA